MMPGVISPLINLPYLHSITPIRSRLFCEPEPPRKKLNCTYPSIILAQEIPTQHRQSKCVRTQRLPASILRFNAYGSIESAERSSMHGQVRPCGISKRGELMILRHTLKTRPFHSYPTVPSPRWDYRAISKCATSFPENTS